MITEKRIVACMPAKQEVVEPEITLNVRALTIKFFVGLLVLVAILGGLGYLFKDPLLAWSKWFIDTFGVWGVASGFFFGDGLTLPIPQDAFTAFGLLGGMSFWTVALWGSLGSLFGACMGYAIGRSISHTNLFKRLLGRKGEEIHQLAKKYGVMVLVLGALTPITYSVCVWSVAALGMRFRVFFALTLLRIPRIVFYLWLIQLGMLSLFA